MHRIRVERKPVKHPRPGPDVLPLDPRDPDIVRAKTVLASKDTTPKDRAA